MPADASKLRFFVDESALGVGKALERARSDVVHAGHPLSGVELGAQDPDWIPVIASRQLVAIGRDRRIRTKPGELALLREHGLRYLWIAGNRDLSTWDQLRLMVRRWDDIERQMAVDGPWFIAIQQTGLAELRVGH